MSSHCVNTALLTKMPGDSPRLLRQPSIAERYLVYITGQDALSSRNYNKQTFDIQRATRITRKGIHRAGLAGFDVVAAFR